MNSIEAQRKRVERVVMSLSGSFLGAFGAIVLLGWYISNSWLIQIEDGLAPVQPNAALCFVFCAVGLIATGVGRHTIAIAASALVSVVAGLTLYEYAFDTNIGIDTLLLIPKIVDETSQPGRMAPNTGLCLVLAAIAVVLFNIKGLDRYRPSAAGSLGLVVFCIGFVALYGYLADVKPAYGWGTFTRMALPSTFACILLGISILWLGWRRQISPESELETVWFWIKGWAFIGVLFVALISAFLGVLSLYVHIQEENRSALTKLVQARAEAVDVYATELIKTATDISQHPQARAALLAFSKGALSEEELVRKTSAVLPDAVKVRPEIRGMTRIDKDGHPLIAIGRGIPQDQLGAAVNTIGENTYYGPFTVDGGLYLLIVAPIMDDELLGTDFLLIEASGLERALTQPIGIRGRMTLLLGIYSSERLELFEFGPRRGARRADSVSFTDEVFTGLGRAFSGGSGLVIPQLITHSSVLAAYAPVPSVRWAVVATVDTASFNASADRELIHAGLAILVIALAGGFAILLVIRTLTKYARSLADRLEHSNTELNKELVERKKTEEMLRERERQLEKSVDEKELLLGEVHHRVKNNLQLVSTIFNLQRRRTNDDKILTLLNEGQSRVRSIALLHESLYRSHEFAQIDAAAYLQDIVANAIQSFGAEEKISFEIFSPQRVHLDLDQAIPCGLIVNELVTNAVKHAFPKARINGASQIAIYLGPIEDETVELRISDNGVGLPAQFDVLTTSSLGMRIVNSLCKQLKADLRVTNGKGTTFTITFPLNVTQKEQHETKSEDTYSGR